jgi:hypothetical protein
MAMTTTALQAARVMYPNMFDQWELRGTKYGLLDLALANSEMPQGIISSDLMEKAAQSWGQAIEIPVMSPSSALNGTGLTCSYTGTEAISALVNVTWVTVSNGFEMQPAKNFQNTIKYNAEFARKYTDAVRAMALAIDGVIDAALTTNTTPGADYNSSYVGVGNRYPFTGGNVMDVSLADRPNFFNDLTDILAADDLTQIPFDVVGSTNLRSIVKQLFAQGDANDTNTAYQFRTGDFDFKFSNRVVLTPLTSDATGFAMPKGSINILSRNSPDCMAGTVTTKGHVYGTAFEPVLGVDMDTLFYSDCADINVLTGNALDVSASNEVHQMAVHYAILTPYILGATPSGVIRKFDLLKV